MNNLIFIIFVTLAQADDFPVLKPPTVVPPEAKKTTPMEHPVITTIKKKDRTLVVKTGPQGPLYTVLDKKGNAVVSDISETDLAKKDPELHKWVKSAIAGNSKAQGLIDASNRRTPPVK